MILITGASGYIGSKLKKRLEDVVECDLRIGTDILSYDIKEKIDVVYHLAAQSSVVYSITDPINDARQNILGTLKAIELANNNNALLIYTASASSVDVKSPYGLSKKTGEDYIKLLCKKYVILRLSNVYGERNDGVVDIFLNGEVCKINGDGSAVRDFVNINDIIDLLVMAKDWEVGSYECGSGQGTKIIDIAIATNKIIIFEKEISGEIKESIIENTTPNWQPKINVIDYIRKSL